MIWLESMWRCFGKVESLRAMPTIHPKPPSSECKTRRPWSWKFLRCGTKWSFLNDLFLRALGCCWLLHGSLLSGSRTQWHGSWSLALGSTCARVRFGLAKEDVTLDKRRAVVFISSSKGQKNKFLPLERLDVQEKTALLALKKLCKQTTAGPF